MKHVSLLVAIVASLALQTGCKSLPDNPPIAPGKMSKILLDMQIAESYSLGLGDSVTNKFEKNYDSLGVFYHSIFKKYDISYGDFKDAMNWYKARPPKIDSLFLNVLDQLSEIKAKEKIKDYDPSIESNPVAAKTDSLNKNKDTSIKKVSHKKQKSTDTIAQKKSEALQHTK